MRMAICTLALLCACKQAGPGERIAAALDRRLAQRGIAARTSCPDVEQRAGARAVCTAKDRAGRPIEIEVTIGDEAGAFDWRFTGTVVDTRRLAEEITAQRRGWAVPACDDDVVVLARGASFECPFVDMGVPRRLTITATGEPGHRLTWEVERGR